MLFFSANIIDVQFMMRLEVDIWCFGNYTNFIQRKNESALTVVIDFTELKQKGFVRGWHLQ